MRTPPLLKLVEKVSGGRWKAPIIKLWERKKENRYWFQAGAITTGKEHFGWAAMKLHF